ncbi:RNA polymerase factor sigma-54 [Aquibacillus sp. 3ASR75-11]|uniref:RNA polymerase factor sigma-54 n=1 Tax=Terrihalobacillus insolitus TaxID=2950438 RepID=A0A9X3WR09_9BACI|nr:RNA polymerase factor sigma-54 [Terrihalobacillus insolitus]MDC3423123.1 RNA polymerase factor sigma-54 [Terrihalobacillus insolitus]
MEIGLFQEQKMKLTMTTDLQQAISILQYSTLELFEYIQNQALENPLIDVEEPSFKQMEPLTKSRSNGSVGNKDMKSPIDFVSNKKTSLYEYLINQAIFLNVSKKESDIINYIIYALNRNGYFEDDLIDTAAHLKVSVEDVKNALKKVQQLEPIGIGATSLQECLSIQLHFYYKENELAEEVVTHYLNELASNKWSIIAKELNISLPEVQHIYDLIQTLNPKPGERIDEDFIPNYIIPDMTVKLENDKLIIMVNDQTIPTIKINADYEPLLSSTFNKDSQTAKYLQSKYKQFTWLNKSIEHRKWTLYNVMKTIAQEQALFFKKGPQHLRPMTLKEVAEHCDVHESTVSRATNNKYVQTPHGLFELKYFFSSSIRTERGENASSHRIKLMIKELIQEEDHFKPLSDQKITTLLKDQNILISRRTVAKYREELGIPSSSSRKRY